MKAFFSFLDEKRPALVFALLLGLGFLAYGRSLSAPFYFDDYIRIADNPFIKHFTPQVLWEYDPSRFITNLTFSLNFLAVRFDLTVWHFINLLLHIFNSYLVYRLTFLTFQTPAFRNKYPQNEQAWLAIFSSLIFLLHPIQTQAVIYLVQRSTLLYALFYLATIYFYARGRLEGRGKYYALAAVTAFLGMFTKTSFMTLPLAIALYDLCFFGFDKKKDIKRQLTYFLLALLPVVMPVLIWNSGLSAAAAAGFAAGDFATHFWTYFRVIITFFRLLVLPVGLNLDYDYPLSTGPDLPALFSFLAVGCLFGAAYKTFKNAPWVMFCTFWFFIALGAQTIFFPLADVIYEHWLYLSVYGFSFLIVILLRPFFNKRTAYLGIVSLLLTVMFILTWQRSALWGDPIAFLEDVAVKSPKKARVHNNVGNIYRQLGDLEKAQAAFEKAVVVDPGYYLAQSNLADVHIIKKEYEQAKSLLEKVIKENPGSAEAFFNLGHLYAQLGDDKQALFNLNRAQLLNPYYSHVHMGLGNIYEKQGDLIMARQELSQALWLDPENPNIYYNLGNVNFQLKNFYEAMINYNEALRRKPDFSAAANNLGHIYFYFQDFKKAQEQYQKAIAGAPNSPESYYHLANVLHAMGDLEGSKKMIRTALKLYREQGQDEMADSIQGKLDALN